MEYIKRINIRYQDRHRSELECRVILRTPCIDIILNPICDELSPVENNNIVIVQYSPSL